MSNQDIDLLIEPTQDVACIMEMCSPYLAPTQRSWFTIFISTCTVAPLANLTPLALEYQLYLCRIFHRRNISFYGHALTMPMIMSIILALIPETYAPWVVLILFLWYATWGVIGRVWWLGLASLPILILCYTISTGLRDHDNLWLWLMIFSQIQAWSHVVEDLPPRVSGTPLWMSKSAFLSHVRSKLDLLQRIIRLIVTGLIFGPIDELIASPRLLPIFWALIPGHWIMKRYDSTWPTCRRLDELEHKFKISFNTDNAQPAIDYIGLGGGGFARIQNDKLEVDTEASWINQISDCQ